MTAIIYTIDFAAIARAHADHERRRVYTRQWRRNRERVGMAQKAA